jgi:hypothetical protein
VPTVLRIGPYRFYFFSHEGTEPPHIHVDRNDSTAKFWMKANIQLSSSVGFNAKEIRMIQKMVEENHQFFLEAWNGYFSSSSR